MKTLEKELFTRKEVSEIMTVHTDTVRNWEKSKLLPVACTINGRPRYHKKDLDRLTSPKENQ